MKKPIEFFVPGYPQPAGSKRAFVIKKGGAYTGRAIVTDANPKAKDWKGDVSTFAVKAFREVYPTHYPWDCAIKLVTQFTMPRPKSHFGSGKNSDVLKESAPTYPASKPDTTKLLRAIEDALTGIIWIDDAQVVTQEATKRYGAPGVWIRVFEQEDPRKKVMF